MAAASLTLGLIHLFVWFKQRSQVAHLLFFALAVSATAFSVFELAMMHSPSSAALRHHTALGARAAGDVRAVDRLVRAFPLRRRAAVACLVGHRCAPDGIGAEFRYRREHQLSEVTAMDRLTLWGGTVVFGPVGVANPLAIVPQIGNLLLAAFVVDASITLWRRGGADARRRAVVVGGGVVVCVAAVAGFAALTTLGLVHAPTIVMPGFFMIVLAMGYELGWDLIAAAHLAARLRASENALPRGGRSRAERDPRWSTTEARSHWPMRRRKPCSAIRAPNCSPCRSTGWFPNASAARTPACATRYALDPQTTRDGRRPRAVCLPQGRQRVPGGGGAQSDGHRRRAVRTGLGGRHQRIAGASNRPRHASATSSRTCRGWRCWASCPDRWPTS